MSRTIFLFLTLFGWSCGASAGEARLHARSFLNQHAPALVVEKWITPEPDIRGKFVLLDFWATWCPPCKQTVPLFNQLQRKFADKLVVIGISSQPEGVVRSMTEPRIEYSSAIDTQARSVNQIEVTKIPHTMLIDPNGIVRWEGFPLAENHQLTEEIVQGTIERGRPGKPGATSQTGLAIIGPKFRSRLRVQLTDGRVLEGQRIGTFGQRTTLLMDGGVQTVVTNKHILWMEPAKQTR